MSRFITWSAVAGLALWTAFCWLAYGVIDLFGAAAIGATGVPGFAPEPFSLAWFAQTARGMGAQAVGFVWATGVAAIGLGALVATKLTGRGRRREPLGRRSWGSVIRSGPAPEPRRRLDLEGVAKDLVRRFSRR